VGLMKKLISPKLVQNIDRRNIADKYWSFCKDKLNNTLTLFR